MGDVAYHDGGNIKAFFHFPLQRDAAVGNVSGLRVNQELLGIGTEIDAVPLGGAALVASR